MHRWYRTDSDGEYEFARALENDERVRLFTKLRKGGLIIETPEGSYSPDWAIVYQSQDGSMSMYFVIETKMDKEAKDLTDVEKLKIRCGKLHFKAVSDIIKFDWVNSYKKFLGAVSLPSILKDSATQTEITHATIPPATSSAHAAMADFRTYPYTDTDRAICAVALALIAKAGSMSSAEHLDAVLLATHPDICRVFLVPAQQSSFSQAIKTIPSEFFLGEGQPVKWQECCRYLESSALLSINRSDDERPISRGSEALSSSQSTADVDTIVQYALSALKRVMALKRSLASASIPEKQAINILERWHTGVA